MKKKALPPDNNLAFSLPLLPKAFTDVHPTQAERDFASRLRETALEPTACTACGILYLSISYHLLRVCTAPALEPAAPLITAVASQPMPHQVEQTETPILEREGGVNDLCESYPYKSKGMDDADKMHPSYRPPAPYIAKSTPYVAPQEETPKEERPPHFWHWVRPRPPKKVTLLGKTVLVPSRGPEPYTPSPTARRRSIPAIACSLYYASWACYHSKDADDNAPPGCVKANKLFYEIDQAKVERLIGLLVFCQVPEEAARSLAREAWQNAKEGIYRIWPDRGEKKGIGRWKIEQLGYELGDQEDDGYMDTLGASLGEFANKEGMKGR